MPLLIGDPNALPNWEYKENPFLIILMILFSLLIAVYLMNLLIGLLNMHLCMYTKENNRVSYLIQKAEVFIKISCLFLLVYIIITINTVYILLDYSRN